MAGDRRGPDRARLLAACAESEWPGLRIIVLLALVTGASRGELAHLQWADVDFDKCTAIARHTKNGSDNLMALPASVVKLLREWKMQCGSATFAFPHPGNPNVAHYEWSHHWNVAREAAGFPTLRFHALTHSAASMAVENGASDRQVAELLNHKTLAMAQRYSHVREAVTRCISETLAEGLL